MKRWLKWLTLVMAALLLGCGMTLWLLYRASQQVPDFYQAVRVQTLPQAERRELGDELERRVLDLHNQSRRHGQWEAEFTEDQLNAWLATQLPQSFPRLMPPSTRDPRVKLMPDSVQAGCLWEHESLKSVVSVEAQLYLTDKPNQLAIRLRSVRAGLVPLPLGRLLERISETARRGGLHLDWGQEDGDPVALLQIPARHENYRFQEVHLTGVHVEEERVRIVGQTERLADAQESSSRLGLSDGPSLPLDRVQRFQ